MNFIWTVWRLPGLTLTVDTGGSLYVDLLWKRLWKTLKKPTYSSRLMRYRLKELSLSLREARERCKKEESEKIRRTEIDQIKVYWVRIGESWCCSNRQPLVWWLNPIYNFSLCILHIQYGLEKALTNAVIWEVKASCDNSLLPKFIHHFWPHLVVPSKFHGHL